MGYPDKGMDTWLVTLDQLDIKDNKFMMTYDFGEDYEFVIEILEQIENNNNQRESAIKTSALSQIADSVEIMEK